jgi:hypothetical protein
MNFFTSVLHTIYVQYGTLGLTDGTVVISNYKYFGKTKTTGTVTVCSTVQYSAW